MTEKDAALTREGHTEGPWFTTGQVGQLARGRINLAGKYLVQTADQVAANTSVALSYCRAAADARLIAASPELLEALEDIIEQFEATRMPIGADLADSIRVFGKQAVAKARGTP